MCVQEANALCVAKKKKEQECWVNTFPKIKQGGFTNIYSCSLLPFNHFSNAITSKRHVFGFHLLCEFRTVIVNIIYLLSSLPRALITLTGSFNWIDNPPLNPPTSTQTHSHIHKRDRKTQNQTFPRLLPAYSYQSSFFQALQSHEC